MQQVSYSDSSQEMEPKIIKSAKSLMRAFGRGPMYTPERYFLDR